MKKLSIVIAGLMFSGAAFAVQFPATGPLLQQECANLNEDVTLTLTNGVVAGVNCRAAAAGVVARVAIAACHTGGMQKSRSTTQRIVPADPAVVGSVATTVTGCATGSTGCTVVPVTGASMPGATTLLGTVNIAYPGTGACTAAAAETQAGTL